MPVVSTGLSTKGLKSAFFSTFEQTTKGQAFWQDLCTTIPSKADGETYRWLGTVPQMRIFGTGRKAKGLGRETYTVANEKYEATLEIDRDEVSDDQTGQIMIRVRELAQRAAVFPDYQISQLLINGETANYNSYDGVSFFDAAHVSGASGSQDNQLAFDISAYDSTVTDSPDSPHAQSLRQAFDICVAMMMQIKDDQGEIENRGLEGLVVVCHVGIWRTWLTALNAGLLGQTGTSGGDTNIQTVVPRIIPNPYLTDRSKFYLLRTGGVIRPFIFQDREPIEFAQRGPGSEEEFHREKYYYGVRRRYKLAYGEWKNAVVCDLE